MFAKWFARKKSILAGVFLYWLIINVLTLHPPFSIFPLPDITPLTTAQFLEFDGDNPYLLPERGWQEIQLPDDWYESKKESNHYWYRVYFEYDTDDEKIWKVYLPSVTHNAEVYINGVWIGRGGGFDDPVSRHHNEPLAFEFDSSILTFDNNVAEIRVKTSFHRQGYLGPVFIAPSSFIDPSYRFKKFVRVDLIQWLTVVMLLLSLVVFLFGMARRSDFVYLLFSLQLLIWSLHNLNLFVRDIPTSALFWEAMTMVTLGWTVVLMLIFNHHFLKAGSKTVERAALLAGVLGSSIFFLPSIGDVLTWGYSLWDSLLVVIGIYCIGFLIHQYWTKNSSDALLMIIAGIPILVFGFHDILLVNHFRDRAEGLIIQYSAFPAILLFTWFLIRRFVQSLNVAEDLTATLEQRVKDRESELKTQYAQLQVLENEKTIAGERERIMRDMHDGIGGHLVALATRLQEEVDPKLCDIRNKVQNCITDLRLVIDSLDPMLNDLPTLLGTMRMRLAYLLESAGMTLQWEVEDLPVSIETGPNRNLQIMRIVQEAITNSIKHSHAERLLVSASFEHATRRVRVQVKDFGSGFCGESLTISRGVKNMQFRAEKIGAEIKVSSSAEGTVVDLFIPC